MSIADKIRARQAAMNGAAASVSAPVTQAVPVTTPAPQIAPTPTPAPTPAPVPTLVATTTAADGTWPPPWTNPACIACKGVGFNTAGSPCKICNVSAAQANRMTSDMFEITPMEGGLAYWKNKINAAVEGMSHMAKSAVPTTQTPQVAPQTTPATQPAPAGATASTQAPAPVSQSLPAGEVPQTVATQVVPNTTATAAAPAADESNKGRGRPKKGFTLILNANVTKGGKCTRLIDVFYNLQADLAKVAGIDYHDMDAFRRRDEIAKVAEAVAEQLGNDLVTADVANGTPDFKALVEALRPLAGVEIVAG